MLLGDRPDRRETDGHEAFAGWWAVVVVGGRLPVVRAGVVDVGHRCVFGVARAFVAGAVRGVAVLVVVLVLCGAVFGALERIDAESGTTTTHAAKRGTLRWAGTTISIKRTGCGKALGRSGGAEKKQRTMLMRRRCRYRGEKDGEIIDFSERSTVQPRERQTPQRRRQLDDNRTEPFSVSLLAANNETPETERDPTGWKEPTDHPQWAMST